MKRNIENTLVLAGTTRLLTEVSVVTKIDSNKFLQYSVIKNHFHFNKKNLTAFEGSFQFPI